MSDFDTKSVLNNFTPAELVKLEEFRTRVSKIYPECNQKLITWLRARELVVDKAEQMLRRHLVWRKNNEIEKLLDWKSPKAFFPYILLDFDNDGAPVFLLPFGHWDLRSCIETGDIIPALRFIFQCLEMFISTGNEIGIYEGVAIIDFEGFEYRQIAHRTVIQGIIEILRIFESNYPEVLKQAYVINAPKIFNVLFAIVKPILHSRTLSKITIFNSDRHKWLEALLKVMSKDILPEYWGGTRIGCDEYCSDSWFQEPLPRYFMRKLSSNYDEFGEEWFTIKVHAKECLTFEYLVEANQLGVMDSRLKWTFQTDYYDIGFAVCYEDESKFLVEYGRVKSHEDKQSGCLQLEKPGTYILQFDNSYSRSRAKILHYSVHLSSVEIPAKNRVKRCSIGHVTLNTDDDVDLDKNEDSSSGINNDDDETNNDGRNPTLTDAEKELKKIELKKKFTNLGNANGHLMSNGNAVGK